MTSLDEVIARLSARLRQLDRRAQGAFFHVCSTALLPLTGRWHASHRAAHLAFSSALSAAGKSLREEVPLTYLRSILEALEEATPGESPVDYSTTGTQHAYICADTSLRISVEPEFEASYCVEYALEPIFGAVAESLFGFSQPGSESEIVQTEAITNSEEFLAAVRFCDLLIDKLVNQADFDEVVLAKLALGSEKLLPAREQ